MTLTDSWRALMLLVIGCILVASPSFNSPTDCDCSAASEGARMLMDASAPDISSSSSSSSSRSSSTTSSGSIGTIGGTVTMSIDGEDGSGGTALADAFSDSAQLDKVLGMCAVFAMTAISGFSSVYFEAILKPKAGTQGPSLSIWGRNFQLSFFSLVLLVAVLLCERLQAPPSADLSQGYVPFKGWGPLPMIIALTQAAGGLLVALALRYTDAVLKVVATSGSIVLSTVLGTTLLDGKMDSSVVLGVISTIIAIFNYTFIDE